ncbi:hypothetical protein RND81_08G074000 [Saponaria officinalis]|uniref:Protein kinase domain-containing protein n=1 Tax=Saponaria officinalis TaxID=3572 RepID=A0AAW1J4L8_SAPOF
MTSLFVADNWIFFHFAGFFGRYSVECETGLILPSKCFWIVNKHSIVKICDFGSSRMMTESFIKDSSSANTPKWIMTKSLIV